MPALLEDASRPNAVVLVVDDNPIDRARIVELLHRASFDVHELPSPIGATRKAREVGAHVVVLDQHMPAMDGSKLAALFRRSDGNRSVRVVLVSADAIDDASELVRKAQVDAFLRKHDLDSLLVSTVSRLARA
jgi:CheY-like chemotaxis protein